MLGRLEKSNGGTSMQKNIKVGDRIYFECPLTGVIGSRIVIDITPDNGTDYYGNPILFNWLKTGPHEGIEDYNTIAPSNPKVKAYIKEMKAKREALINEALMFAYPDRKSFSKDERMACERLLDFAYTKMKDLEEFE